MKFKYFWELESKSCERRDKNNSRRVCIKVAVKAMKWLDSHYKGKVLKYGEADLLIVNADRAVNSLGKALNFYEICDVNEIIKEQHVRGKEFSENFYRY